MDSLKVVADSIVDSVGQEGGSLGAYFWMLFCAMIVTPIYAIHYIAECIKRKQVLSRLDSLPETRNRLYIKSLLLTFASVVLGIVTRLLEGTKENPSMNNLSLGILVLSVIAIVFSVVNFKSVKRKKSSEERSDCINGTIEEMMWIFWVTFCSLGITSIYIDPDIVYVWKDYISVEGLWLLIKSLLIISKFGFTIIKYKHKF